MAKKTVASPTTATQKTSKSRTEPKVSIPSAQRYFWDYADKVWQNAETYQVELAARRPFITKEYIAAQLAYVAEVKALPDNDVRTAQSNEARLSLSAHRQAVMTEVNLLSSGIEAAYENEAELIPAQLKAVGITALRAATVRDWAAVSTFLTTSKAYLQNNGAKLIGAGTIAPEFAAGLETVGNEFNAAKAAYFSQKGTAHDGTLDVKDGIKNIKKAISKVLKLGKQVFEFDPKLRNKFTAEAIMDEVRSKHPANIVGRTDLGPVVEGARPKPLANMLVEVLGMEGKSATTDKEGRYKIPIAGGEYEVRYSGPIGASEGMSPVVTKVVVKPGVDRRVNVTLAPVGLEPAPVAVEVAMTKVATPPLASMNDVLSGALKEVKVVPENGALAMNGIG